MPDFDTRTPQEERQDKPLRVRMLLIVNKPRALLMATKRRIPVIANRLRSLLLASKGRGLLVAARLRGLMVANGFRTMLIGGGILLFVVAAVPAGMLIYSSSGMGDQQQEAQQQEEPVSGMQIGSLENINADPDLKRKVVFQLSTPDSSSDSDVSRYGIWTIDANGTGPKQLTDTAEESSHSYEDPARSPDLEKIAFTRVRQEGRVSESLVEGKSAIPYTLEVPYIFVMNADGSDQSQLVDGVGAKPDWSPDGKQIAFSSYEMWSSLGMSEDGECDLYVASADGSDTPRRLTTEPGCESNPSWSPDGTKIAFTHNWRGNLDIYVVSVCCEESETLQPRQLTDDPLDDTEPVWSPDGTKIAFTHSPDDSDSGNVDADIYKMDADGSGKIRLTHSGAMEKQPTWSPDGTKIIFIRQGLPGVNPESTGLFMMDSDGTNPIAVKVFENTTAFFPEWGGAAQQDKVAEGAIEGEHTDQAIADWRALDAPLPEKAVEAYIDQIKRQQEILRSSEEGNDERWMAYVRTGNLLRTLGPASKGKVVRFLAEAGLVQSSRTGWTNSSASVAASASSAGLPSDRSQPIIELIGADLSGANLSGVNLSGADLNQADLRGANLSRANLSRADLTFADLSGADLRGANLSRAYLGGAYLRHTNLSGAELTATDLSGADLSGATGFDEQLELQVGTLDNTIMPDGSRHRRCPSYAPQPC